MKEHIQEHSGWKLSPTLWRTCRTLANRARLDLLRQVWANPGATVAEIAGLTGVCTTLASQYLRALNARGLLAVTRQAACVRYRLEADPAVPQAGILVTILAREWPRGKAVAEKIFRQATALTHSRRVAMVARLSQGPATLAELRRELGISSSALHRHLRKLARRGFLQTGGAPGVYRLATKGPAFSRALLQMATQHSIGVGRVRKAARH